MSGAVLLGRDGKPEGRGPLQIFVPRGLEDEEPLFVCKVPVDAEGNLCGARFYEGQAHQWETHCGACARRNMDFILAARQEARESIFHPSQWDPEAHRHMQKVGRQMLREGRMELRENERIVDG